MNYIKQLNAFHLKIDLEPISIHARVLWYTLTDINNRLVWRQEFTVAMSKLREKAGLTESTFKRARKELEVNGLIQVTNRKGNQSAMYQMVCLYRNVTSKVDYIEDIEPQQKQKVTGKLAHNVDHKPAPLIKEKQKEKENNKTTAATAVAFFQNNSGKITPFIAGEINHWANDLGEPLVLYAMKRALGQGKTNWGYVKGILNAWLEKGIISVESAREEEAAYRGQHGARTFGQGSASQSAEIVPDWFKEQKRKKGLEREWDKEAVTKRDCDADYAEAERLLVACRGGGG